jgi:hypothetical protein
VIVAIVAVKGGNRIGAFQEVSREQQKKREEEEAERRREAKTVEQQARIYLWLSKDVKRAAESSTGQ